MELLRLCGLAEKREWPSISLFEMFFPSKASPWAIEHETIFIGSENILVLLSCDSAQWLKQDKAAP